MRMDEGVHENATIAYHSFNGLTKILDHKSKKLDFSQLRGLNQARKLLVKAGELSVGVWIQAVGIGDIKWGGGSGWTGYCAGLDAE